MKIDKVSMSVSGATGSRLVFRLHLSREDINFPRHRWTQQNCRDPHGLHPAPNPQVPLASLRRDPGNGGQILLSKEPKIWRLRWWYAFSWNLNAGNRVTDQSCSISIFWFQYQYQYFLNFVFNSNINTDIKISPTCNINTNINTGRFFQYQYQNFENLQSFDWYQYFFDKIYFS